MSILSTHSKKEKLLLQYNFTFFMHLYFEKLSLLHIIRLLQMIKKDLRYNKELSEILFYGTKQYIL